MSGNRGRHTSLRAGLGGENGTVTYTHDSAHRGTVNYTYDGAHRVTSRTDALGQYTQYTYDSYERLTAVDYFPQGSGAGEDDTQRVTYTYDSCSNGVGYLCYVTFGSGVTPYDMQATYEYAYTYNTAGRVLTQTMYVNAYAGTQNTTLVSFASAYQWDDEGRMTSMQYPTVTTAAYAP